MEQDNKQQRRLVWIDWMKAIGIYFIVLGHFFSVGDKFIYVFNGPLFFVISGFLCKREVDQKVFWTKLWNNLVIPMIIICMVNFLIDIVKVGRMFTDYEMKYYLFQDIIGMQSTLGTCWFVYSLIIIRVIYQYSYRSYISILLVFLFGLFAYVYNHFNLSICSVLNKPNSILAVFVTYPAFMFGAFFHRYKNWLSSLKDQVFLCLLFVIGIIIVLLCGFTNDYVWIYQCGYGSNLFLYLLGVVGGSAAVYALSIHLSKTYPKWMALISKGTIIIMGFHPHLINIVRSLFPNPSMMDFWGSAFIVLAFIPVIILADKFFPLILGKHSKLLV